MSTRRTRRRGAEPAPVRRPRQPTDHLLELLTYSGWPLTVGELREHGISAPAQTIYELQLAGYEIDRVPVRHDGHCDSGYRLHPPPLDDPGRAESAPSYFSRRRTITPSAG